MAKVPADFLDDVAEALRKRGTSYGKFAHNAQVTRMVLSIYHAALEDADNDLGDTGCEALHMIVHKLARIANGDNSADTIRDCLTDVIGYASLWLADVDANNDE